MKKTLIAAAAAAVVAAGAASASAATINVLRGTESATVDTGGRGVTVLKGNTAATPSAPAVTTQPAHHAVAAAGVLWLVERETGRLVACGRRGTGYAGQLRLYCVAQELR